MRIAFLGAGKLAAALARGVVQAGVAKPEDVRATARSDASRRLFTETSGVQAEGDNANADIAAWAEVVVLAVKPPDIVSLLAAIAPRMASAFVISVAAGIPLGALQSAAGRAEIPIARVMPNTPSLVGHGAAAYALGASATSEHARTVETIFGAVGEVHLVKEEWLDAVLGVSASGVAYVLAMIEAMADGGVLMGLPRPLALRLAAATVAGAGELVRQTDRHPALLREDVTSPGGTTAAALEKLEQHGFRSALLAAVRAATERSREMGKCSAVRPE